MILQHARLALAAPVLAALLLAGCGGEHQADPGPLKGGTGHNRLCGPLRPPQKVFTAGGIWQVTNSGPPAVLDKVTLARMRGLKILAAYAVLVTGHEEYGNWLGYPAPRDAAAGVHWSTRQPADGARVPRRAGKDVMNLVLVVKLLGTTGSADGLDIKYHTSRGHYRLYISNGLTLTTARTVPNCPT